MSNYPEQPSQQPEAMQAAQPAQVRVALPQSTPYVTYTIVGITVLAYLLQLASTRLLGPVAVDSQLDWLELYGAKINTLIQQGQLWRLITPVLLHASVPHIAFNMYALWVFGIGLERNFGHWRFLVLYLLGGFAGNVLSFLFSSGYSVGASTAIFGLVAAEGVFLFQNRKLFGRQYGRLIGNIIFVVAVNLFLVGMAPGIDNWGHIGGLLGGLIFSLFAGPLWEVRGTMPSFYMGDKREPRDVITGAAMVLLIFGALALWGITHPFLTQ